MHPSTLAAAVASFAQATIGIADADLEREYTWRYHGDEGLRFALIGTYHELRDLAAATAAERARVGPPITLAQRVLAQYHAAYRDLQAGLLGVSHADAQRPLAEGEWPLWIALVHMIMTEQQFYPRIVHAVAQRSAGIAPSEMTDGERVAFLLREPANDPLRLLWFVHGDTVSTWEEADEAPPPQAMTGQFFELLAYYDSMHARVLRDLAGLTDEDLQVISLWWEAQWCEDGNVPVGFRLHRFDAHLRQHTIQVDKTLTQLGLLPSEAKRLLRLIYAGLAEAEGATLGAEVPRTWDDVAAGIVARADEVARLMA
ncbi:MAG TPA: DinB family protein [Roseiflexaceae bacterium]|nr:DinB family protein [Roseiflexaceae bacterium]